MPTCTELSSALLFQIGIPMAILLFGLGYGFGHAAALRRRAA